MKFRRSHLSPICRLARAFALALLAIGLLAPATATAAHCGRYVSGEAGFERELARLVAGDATADDASVPALPLPPAGPCKGSFCSAPPPPAPAVPPAPPTRIGEHWPCLIAPLAVSPSFGLPFVPDDAAMTPVGRALAVFHPPRQVAPSA